MMRRLDDVGLVLAPTYRSRAYIQMLAARGLAPRVVFRFPGAEPVWDGPREVVFESLGFVFRPGLPIADTVAGFSCPVIDMPNRDINSPESIAVIAGQGTPVTVYSGISKVLLTDPVLAAGTRFLHVHGGHLPGYRGATAFYFGLLRTGKLGVTAFWMDRGVDTGEMLGRAWFEPLHGVSVDNVLDPVYRAQLLADVLEHKESHGTYPALAPEPPQDSHFVIHPVLKNLALNRVGITGDA